MQIQQLRKAVRDREILLRNSVGIVSQAALVLSKNPVKLNGIFMRHRIINLCTAS